jgi:TPP-dependent pyruvate/acetoin dehydrogenase alpha subunit
MISDKLALDIYRKMILSRRLEERIAELIKSGQAGGFMHPGVGQEALQVAAIAALRPDDYIMYAHRGVAYWVAREIALDRILCDLAGKEGGSNKGRGGVMHVVDSARGVLGESGTLGGCFPIATGAGLSIKVKKQDKVVLCFFGDGTSNRGTFHESANMCAVKKLPVIFLCENNGWAVSVPTTTSTANPDIVDRAKGYNMPGRMVDGNNITEVYGAVAEAVAHARRGEGPSLIEAKTYRLWGHWIGDPDDYRTREEVEKQQLRDPLAAYERELMDKKMLNEAEIEQINSDARLQIDKAVASMQAAKFPSPESALEDVYAK